MIDIIMIISIVIFTIIISITIVITTFMLMCSPVHTCMHIFAYIHTYVHTYICRYTYGQAEGLRRSDHAFNESSPNCWMGFCRNTSAPSRAVPPYMFDVCDMVKYSRSWLLLAIRPSSGSIFQDKTVSLIIPT